MLFDERACCSDNMSQPEMASPYMSFGGYMPEDRCCPQPICPPPCPIIEPPIEKCIKRDFCHEVKHICPIHTKIINNHIFRHTYAPHYTCSEENVVCNTQLGSCCDFV